jgi:HSP20 family protein
MDLFSKTKTVYNKMLGQEEGESPTQDIQEELPKEDKTKNYHFNTDDAEGQLALDVYHTANDVIIKAPIAGVTLQDISITISDGILTIRGARHEEDEAEKDDYYLQECYWGVFSRSVVLPKGLKTEEIQAFFKNGILRVTIPKSEDIKIRSIPINSVSVLSQMKLKN